MNGDVRTNKKDEKKIRLMVFFLPPEPLLRNEMWDSEALNLRCEAHNLLDSTHK